MRGVIIIVRHQAPHEHHFMDEKQPYSHAL